MTPNTRKPEESQADFKLRRSAQNLADKMIGFTTSEKVLWPAHKGTYVQKIHGPLVHS